MKEVFTMWRHTQMVVLVALTAAIYAATLIPTQFLPIIPGFTNLRPANVFPFVFGLLFGPAGAWGPTIGNLIKASSGTLGLGGSAGFCGKFFPGFPRSRLGPTFLRRGGAIGPKTKPGKKTRAY